MMRHFSGWPFDAKYLRAILTAPSFASAPELQKNALSAKEWATSRLASFSCSGDLNRLETCHSFAACSWIARTRCGWLWPSAVRSEEHTSELQSLMRISYAVFCLKKKNIHTDKRLHCIQ